MASRVGGDPLKLLKGIDRAIDKALEWSTSTKSAFYVLNIIIISAVIISPPISVQGWLLVIVSEYYQGVALPGLGAGTKRSEQAAKRQGEQTRELLQETHDATLTELAEMKQMVQELHQMHAEKVESDKDRDTKLNEIIEMLRGCDEVGTQDRVKHHHTFLP